MTDIVLHALLFTGIVFGLLILASLISSKIKRKKNYHIENQTLLQKKTNIREIYLQNINRSLGKTEFKKENIVQKTETPQRQTQKIRLVKETYNYNSGFQSPDKYSKYSNIEMFKSSNNFGRVTTMQKYYLPPENE